MDEQRHAIGGRSAAQDGSGFHHLAHVDLRELAGDGRHGGVNLNVVVDAQQAVAIVREIRTPQTQDQRKRSSEFHQKQYMPESAV